MTKEKLMTKETNKTRPVNNIKKTMHTCEGSANIAIDFD
jgi:hypothetical protein